MIAAKALLPVNLSCRRIITTGNATIAHDEEIVAVGNRRRHIGNAFFRTPRNVRLRHVTRSVRSYSKNVQFGKTAGQEEQIMCLVIDKGSNKLLCRPLEN